MRSLVLLSLFFVSALAQANPMCGTFTPSGGYCIYPGSPQNADVVYYFHGKEDDPAVTEPYKRWGESNYYPRQIRDYWAAKGMAAPTVISVSLANIWLFNDQTLHLFTAQIRPALENAIGGLRGRRLIVGESMGGFNTTQLAFRTALFEKAAILCAPMVDGVSPFSPPEEIEAYMKRSTAYSYHGEAGVDVLRKNIGDSVNLARYFFPTPAAWAAADPLQLAAHASVGGALKQVYVAAGFHDSYVLYEGNVKFASLLTRTGVDVDWRPQWGGHCAMDIPSLAEFLIK